MMLHNYPAIFMNCTARYLILSTTINFWQILKCHRACLFTEHVHVCKCRAMYISLCCIYVGCISKMKMYYVLSKIRYYVSPDTY